jgi:thymidine kinase
VAKLHFYYAAMNAGKSTTLLQSDYNYKERGMQTVLFTPDIDDRYGKSQIGSRIGLHASAVSFANTFNFFEYIEQAVAENPNIRCVMIDEAQFLTKAQVLQLTDVVDYLKLPVLAYGLRTDYKGEPFEGSLYLLALADEVIELKTICHCGRKAIMNMRIDAQGHAVTEGEQIVIGGNESYISTCRLHFKERGAGAGINPL